MSDLGDFSQPMYQIPVAYGFGSVSAMFDAYNMEPVPMNSKDIALQWTGMPDVKDEEVPRVFGTAVILHANTPDTVSFWDCLYVAWIFERG